MITAVSIMLTTACNNKQEETVADVDVVGSLPATATLPPEVTKQLPRNTRTPTASPPATATLELPATEPPPTNEIMQTATAIPSATKTNTPEPTETATVPPTPEPFNGLTIDELTARDYGGGDIQILETLEETAVFTRQSISYPSDELTITGQMIVPAGDGPFPVVIVIHGDIEAEDYTNPPYTTEYADHLARNGFLVIHPDLRNFAEADKADDLFRVGSTIDVLNLVAIVEENGGQSGALSSADAENINLWGHSMGGHIALRAAVVYPAIQRVVLYAGASFDEYELFKRVRYWSLEKMGQAEMATPAEEVALISPLNYLDRIETAVSMHHGIDDLIVPKEWFAIVCQQFHDLGKASTCYAYPEQGHIFEGEADQLFRSRVLNFLQTVPGTG